MINKEQSGMIGLYIHIPFCIRKCFYCGFDSIPQTKYDEEFIKRYIKCIEMEINRVLENSENINEVDSVYLGGGTPSVLPPEIIYKLLTKLSKSFKLCDDCEITIEINPGTTDEKSLKEFCFAGINRLSIGAQSLTDDILKKLGRIHKKADIIDIYQKSVKTGFKSIGLDFIYGIHGQNIPMWLNEIKEIIDLSPEHISLYCLTPEKGTPMIDFINDGKIEMPADELVAEMMELNREQLSRSGYINYEISNYSKPGFQCRHNLKYWDGSEYIGFGSSAFSYEGKWRYGNFRDPFKYVKIMENGGSPVEYAERLSLERQMGEFIMMGLRMKEGVSSLAFNSRFSMDIEQVFGDIIKTLIAKNLLYKKKTVCGNGFLYYIPEELFPVHNEISENFIFM